MVPTKTEFAHALEQPYDVIHSIIKRRDEQTRPEATSSSATDSDVVEHFRSLFHDQDRTAKISALTPDSLPTLLEHASSAPQTEAKLVRWRCMIQDTGFASEVYQSYQLDEDVSPANSTASLGPTSATYSAFGLEFSLPTAAAAGAGASGADGPDAGGSSSGSSSADKRRAQRRRENEGLRERTVMYAVSVPGETAWARRAYGDVNVHDDVFSASSSPASSSAVALPAPGTSGSNPFSSKSPIPEERHVAGLLKFYDVDGASSSLQVTQVIEAIGILESTPFRAAADDWADLGFAAVPPSASTGATGGQARSGGAPGSSDTTFHGPCLHVLFFNPLPPSTIPQALTEARTPSLSGLASAPEIRAGLLRYLTDALDGDALAAEFLLLALLARVHSRGKEDANGSAGAGAGGAVAPGIGGLSLNLFNIPEATTTRSASSSKEKDQAPTAIPSPPLPKLRRALRNLLPAVVDQSLALAHLNSKEVTFAPRAGSGSQGDAAGESLQAGRLQLPKGTVVLVDELGLGDGGRLNERGVRNVQALSGVLRTHVLEYEYPFHRFSFEAELRVLVLSAGKSFLPVDVHLPLRLPGDSQTPGEDKEEEAVEAAPLPDLAQDTLRLYRLFLFQARHAPFTIDERDGVAERISADFVEARKRSVAAAAAAEKSGKDGGVKSKAEGVSGTGTGAGTETALATQEDLLRRMSIARLLALSRSEPKLSIETWVRAGELDEARLERLREVQSRNAAVAAAAAAAPATARPS